ncbi:MAG TPA: hypothetical protein VHY37_01920, partial [Tepidisphaeraceae bacterium]|nr:hypothetical protein [Tepidisphaeraceae bacterium]
MNWLIKSTNAAIDRAQGRFRLGWRLKSPPRIPKSRRRISRRASVLIIVIGLLVLMAIIGTA